MRALCSTAIFIQRVIGIGVSTRALCGIAIFIECSVTASVLCLQAVLQGMHP